MCPFRTFSARSNQSLRRVHTESLDTVEYINVQRNITKTCLYNVDPLKPRFYTVKLGFTEVYIIFIFLLKTYIVCTC